MPHLLPDSQQPHEAEPVDELAELRAEVAELREEFEAFREDSERDKDNLGAMLHAIRAVLNGETQTAEPQSPASAGPLNPSRYQPWKEKFRGQTSEAIDILVKYEAGLTRKQLASFLKINPGSGSMSQVIFKLNKADLIVKDGNLIRLKRL